MNEQSFDNDLKEKSTTKPLAGILEAIPAMSKESSVVMEQGAVYKLTDLVNSDFEMHVNDPDYSLTHDEVIKVCKIFLHKINFNTKRINFNMDAADKKMTN